MSGGSGGGDGFVPAQPMGGGGRKPGSTDPCEIQIILPLSAVDPKCAETIRKGDKLPVQLRESNGTDTVVALNPKKGGCVVGAIAFKDVHVLIDCLNEGNEYVADVLDHSKTSVKVRVRCA